MTGWDPLGQPFAAAVVKHGWIREQNPVPERNLMLETQDGCLGSLKMSIHWEEQTDEQFKGDLKDFNCHSAFEL